MLSTVNRRTFPSLRTAAIEMGRLKFSLRVPGEVRIEHPVMRLGTVLGIAALPVILLFGCASEPVASIIFPASTSETTATAEPQMPDGMVRNADGTVDSGISGEVWAALNLLEDYPSLPFMEIYGGKELGAADLNVIVVFLTERSEPIEAEVAEYLSLPRGQIEFRDSAHSWAELTEVRERVMTDLDVLAQRYPDIRGFGISPDLEVVLSTWTALEEVEMATMRSVYGDLLRFEVDTSPEFQTADGTKPIAGAFGTAP